MPIPVNIFIAIMVHNLMLYALVGQKKERK